MKYLQGKFSVPVGSKEYRDGWDAIFGTRAALRELTRLTEEAGGYDKELEDKPGSEATNPDLTPPSSNNSQNKQTNADIPESQREGISSTPKDTSEESTPTDTPLPPGHVRLPGGGIRKPRNNK